MTDRTDTPDAERPLPSAGAVVEAFGGIRPMAAKLDIPVTTVQGWKERDRIPKRRWAEIRQAAADQGFDLDALPDADAAGAAIAMPPPGSGAATPAADAGKGTETEKTSETEKTGAVRQDDGPWAASAPEDEIADGSSATDAPASDASGPTAAPDRPPAAAAPRPARRRRSVWPWLVAAFVVAGLAVTWRIWWPMVEEEAGLAGIFQTEPGTGDDAASSSPPAPESRAAAPDSTAPAASSAQGSAASPVEAEIAALKESVRALQAGGGDGGAAQ
ncbi:MAG: hypothetical protein HOH66_05320, partial [Rhodospirillaceae bacterium]|nr:hypothetical protein [Rhodospirillaceae bacterium]